MQYSVKKIIWTEKRNIDNDEKKYFSLLKVIQLTRTISASSRKAASEIFKERKKMNLPKTWKSY